MTPKEKAIELLKKFYSEISGMEYSYLSNFITFFNSGDSYCNRAKKCALIAVDEMLGMLPFPEDEWHLERESFLSEVKQEIEKL